MELGAGDCESPHSWWWKFGFDEVVELQGRSEAVPSQEEEPWK